jgi:hypothetical protein
LDGRSWCSGGTETQYVFPLSLSLVHSPSAQTIRCRTPAAFGPSQFLDEILNNSFYNPTPPDYLDGSTTPNRATWDKIQRKSCWKWQYVLESHQFCMFIFSSCASRWVCHQQGNCQIAKHFHKPREHKLFFLLHFVCNFVLPLCSNIYLLQLPAPERRSLLWDSSVNTISFLLPVVSHRAKQTINLS